MIRFNVRNVFHRNSDWVQGFCYSIGWANTSLCWVVVVAQLGERLLPTPEVCSSNRVIRKIYIEHLMSTV